MEKICKKLQFFVLWSHINPIQQRLPTSSFLVTPSKVGISPQNFLTFTFDPSAKLLQNLKVRPSTSRKLLNLNQDHPLKNLFFKLNPYKIEIMIAYLIEMSESRTFSCITISTIKFKSNDRILLMTSQTETGIS